MTAARVALHDGWSLTATGGAGVGRLPDGASVPAAVPGCAHLDLLRHGTIADPYLDDGEARAAWVGHTDWTYRTCFDADPDDASPGAGRRTHLVAEGLDTVAEVRLNGVVVGRTANMHRSHRFDVTSLLRAHGNELEVAFEAPMRAAAEASARLGARPHVNAHPYNAVRKNASAFGWDWGPDLPTSGIWRPIGLETWRVARLSAVRWVADVRPDGTGVLTVHAELQRADPTDAGELTLRLGVAGQRCEVVVPVGATAAVVAVEVPAVRRWWPRGYGEQHLYAADVELRQDGGQLDARSSRVGFRTVGLEQVADAHGTSFSVRVNGCGVLVRGFNWIPDDVFLPRVDGARYRTRLEQARAAGANLVRIWGGGIYEAREFYQACDELGLLVWQDFPFACAAYAEDAELFEEVRREATEAIERLSPHPSLVLWCGGNECVWGHADWDWQGRLEGRDWGRRYYDELLPALVARLDPSRQYLPNSPFSPRPDRHPNDPAHGPMHIWDVWNERDYTAYLQYAPRFVSEFGFQGPPTWATLTRAVRDEPLTPSSPGMLAHQKAEDGTAKLARGLRGHLPEPTGTADWHWATSLNQARAVALGIEHFRSLAPVCTGAVVWQLNDCWPVTSWSAVDGDGRLKPLWYAVRRAFADRLLRLGRHADGVRLTALNDSAEPWSGDVRLARVDVEGAVLAAASVRLDLASRACGRFAVPADVGTPGDPSRELVIATAGDARGYLWFAEDVELLLAPPEAEVSVTAEPTGYQVDVVARVLLKDLALLVDRLDPAATVDEMLTTLLPGESARFHVRTLRELAPGGFSDPLVLRSANDLVAAPPGRTAGRATWGAAGVVVAGSDVGSDVEGTSEEMSTRR